MVRGMPIAGRKEWKVLRLEQFNVSIQGRNHFVAVGHRQRTAREKIALQVDHDQRIAVRWRQ